MKQKLLIVDDDEEIQTQVKWALSSEYDVVTAQNRAGALEAFRSARPLVVLLDLGLPPHPNSPDEGMAVLSGILNLDASTKVVIVSGQSDRENARRAVASGAWDFLSKPLEIEELKMVLRRCFYVAELEREHLESQQSRQGDSFEGMLGASAAMRAVFNSISKVAPTTAPVLILGESGTGKEMAAAAIHRLSPAKNGPFVPINCSAIPESLLESELFGHEKGAFTGAVSQRKGLIESAEGGTLFLDEIGELPPPIQVKLLRFLQEKTFQRIGGRQEIRSNARIVTATNVDLKAAVAAGTFREDLYFRLAVVTISLPPLRERGNDVILMAKAFLQRFAAENDRKGMSFTPEALRAFLEYSWPGNIRELQNRVQRAVIMADDKRITAADMEVESPSQTSAPSGTLKDARENVEREMVKQALRKNQGRISAAAAELGVSRPTLYELIEKLGISRD